MNKQLLKVYGPGSFKLGDCYNIGTNQYINVYKNNEDKDNIIFRASVSGDTWELFNTVDKCVNPTSTRRYDNINCFNGEINDVSHICNKILQTKCVEISKNTFYKTYGITDGLFSYCKGNDISCNEYTSLSYCLKDNSSCILNPKFSTCLENGDISACKTFYSSSCLDYKNKCKEYKSSSSCISDNTISKNMLPCSQQEIQNKNHWCNKVNLSFLSPNVSVEIDCENLLNDLEKESETENIHRQRINKGTEIIKMIANSLWEDLPNFLLVMAVEESIETIGQKLVENTLKRAVMKTLMRSIGTAIVKAMNVYTIITLVEGLTSLVRGVGGVPLKVYLNREIIDNIMKGAYEKINEQIMNGKQLQCVRVNYKNKMLTLGKESDMKQLEELLNDAIKLYKTVTSVNIFDMENIDDWERYSPCGIPRNILDASGNIVSTLGNINRELNYIDTSMGYIDISSALPCWCNIDQFKILPQFIDISNDLSGKELQIGFYPDPKIDYYYREGFSRYLNQPYDFPQSGIPVIYADPFNEDDPGRQGFDCSDNNYLSCYEGDAFSCNRCSRMIRKDKNYGDWSGDGSITNACERVEVQDKDGVIEIIEDFICLETNQDNKCVKCIRYRPKVSSMLYSFNNNNINDKILKILLIVIIIFCIFLLYFLLFKKK